MGGPGLMSCGEVRQALGAYALGALDRAEAAGVAEHLAGCADCRAELEAYREIVDALPAAVYAAAPARPPAALRARVLAAAGAGAPPVGRARGAAGWRGWLGGAIRVRRGYALAGAGLVFLIVLLSTV